MKYKYFKKCSLAKVYNEWNTCYNKITFKKFKLFIKFV